MIFKFLPLLLFFNFCYLPSENAETIEFLGNTYDGIFLKVKICLYTRQSPITPFIMNPDESASVLGNSTFNSSTTSVIVVGGWQANKDWSSVKGAIIALLLHADVNVLFVDWGAHLLSLNYAGQAFIDGPIAALKTHRFLKDITETFNYSINNYHIIGSSLGAHVAGFIGHLFGGQIPRISLIDPIAIPPGILLHSASFCDAIFVDVIHTSILGIQNKIGHVDFYPNGGLFQPGCEFLLDAFINDPIGYLLDFVYCSHSMATDLYVQSLKSSCLYKAYPCDNYANFTKGLCNSCGIGDSQCNYMGYDALWSQSTPAPKRFYLTATVDQCA